MTASNTDTSFAGSIPQVYERYLVPLIFQFYADDIASRVAALKPSRVLELAAGTGVVTRRLAATLPASAAIVATDINQPMLDHAAAVGTARAVDWAHADAMRLPFPDQSFDVVVCQFGAMFFPDKPHAFAEARRVLRPGGRFVFSVWDRIEDNEFADVVTRAMEPLFPHDPPRFLARTPHGYHDLGIVTRDVAAGGFDQPADVATLTARSRAGSPRTVAVAYCEGTPLRGEIEARGPSRLAEATGAATTALAARFGSGAVDGKMQAHVIVVER